MILNYCIVQRGPGQDRGRPRYSLSDLPSLAVVEWLYRPCAIRCTASVFLLPVAFLIDPHADLAQWTNSKKSEWIDYLQVFWEPDIARKFSDTLCLVGSIKGQFLGTFLYQLFFSFISYLRKFFGLFAQANWLVRASWICQEVFSMA